VWHAAAPGPRPDEWLLGRPGRRRHPGPARLRIMTSFNHDATDATAKTAPLAEFFGWIEDV
jgi:hypothetical protein